MFTRSRDWVVDMRKDGPPMDAMRERVHAPRLTDRIRMLGWVKPETVETVMSQSDILVLPSLSEGLPIVGTRALGTGLATLASDIGDNRDAVHEGINGFLCDPTDIDSFETERRKISTSDEQLVSRKRENRRLAEKLNVDAIGSRFEHLFEASVRSRTNLPAHRVQGITGEGRGIRETTRVGRMSRW